MCVLCECVCVCVCVRVLCVCVCACVCAYIPVTSVDWWLLWLETKSPDPRIGAVRAILEAFQSSLLDRKAANDLLITYLKAEAVDLIA